MPGIMWINMSTIYWIKYSNLEGERLGPAGRKQ